MISMLEKYLLGLINFTGDPCAAYQPSAKSLEMYYDMHLSQHLISQTQPYRPSSLSYETVPF